MIIPPNLSPETQVQRQLKTFCTIIHKMHMLTGAEPAGTQRKYGENSQKWSFRSKTRSNAVSRYCPIAILLSLKPSIASVCFLFLFSAPASCFLCQQAPRPKIQYGCQFERNFDKIPQSCRCWWFPLHSSSGDQTGTPKKNGHMEGIRKSNRQFIPVTRYGGIHYSTKYENK